MSTSLLARLGIGVFVVLGVLVLGFWYLYYRRVLPKLTLQHVPRAKRRYVRNLFVLLGFESTLQCLGWAVFCYACLLISLGGPEQQTWYVVSEASIGFATVAWLVVLLTGGQLRQTLTSLEQLET